MRYKAATLPTPSASTGAMEAGVSGAGLCQRDRQVWFSLRSTSPAAAPSSVRLVGFGL